MRPRTAAGALLVVVVATTAAACQAGEPDSLVASPPPDAEPAQVVQALVDAINARDEELVRDLTTPEYGDALAETWLQGGYLTHAEIGETLADQGAGTAHPDAVGVVVSFVPEQTDVSMPDGERITWGFLLTDDAGSWFVFDAGQG